MNNVEKANVERLDIVSRWLLLRLAEKVSSKKDIYLRNSIAKNISLLRSIEILCDQKQFNQAYILSRSLLDRLVYIYYLNDKNLFDSFEEWTFIKVYEHRNNAKADERFKNILNDPLFKSRPDESHRYTALKQKNEVWVKPDPKTILKSHELDFLYKFGYDYASMHTHPMASDGDFEFYQMTGLEPNPHTDFTFSELGVNSILISTLILQEVFNTISFKFMALCYNMLNEIRKEIGGGENEADTTFKKIVLLIHNRVELFQYHE